MLSSQAVNEEEDCSMHGILLQEEVKSGVMTCQLNTAGSLHKLLEMTALGSGLLLQEEVKSDMMTC